jgi:NADPH-dependent 2,4-dienoyl-CoA reductase/sulfur reductase-like enzyme/nitrite reductase/ring-hydroxylating ferredoxin subunit
MVPVGPKETAMAHSDELPPGPDFTLGVLQLQVPKGGVLAGRVGTDAVLLARLNDGFHAVGGSCTHYGAPLAEGLVVDGEVRCPWHHACFSLRSGRARKAPALAPLDTWQVETQGDRVFVRARRDAAPAKPQPRTPRERIVIVGGGAAGFAAAQRLRELGHAGALVLLSADDAGPYDRPNLSKDYLAGTAPEDWIPLKGADFYAEQGIELHTGAEVTQADAQARELRTRDGRVFGYDALLIATGAEPRALPIPGLERPNVHVLRTLADARSIIAACEGKDAVAFIGAGFIGLEAAGALRQRGLAVHVVAPEAVPMERVLGPELGRFLAGLHAAAGVQFHLGAKIVGYDGAAIALADGSRVPAQVLVVGAGVAPRTQLARLLGLDERDGILVNDRLQTSVPGVYAAGDVARFPWHGEAVRIEHWVHAQRMGQQAAANLLGADQAFVDVPFFWTHHQGLDLRYCGYAGQWEEVRIDGELSSREFTARYFRGGKLVAAACMGRDRESLDIEEQLRA